MYAAQGCQIRTNLHEHDICTSTITELGIYRAEVCIQYLGRRQDWILSNPVSTRKVAIRVIINSLL